MHLPGVPEAPSPWTLIRACARVRLLLPGPHPVLAPRGPLQAGSFLQTCESFSSLLHFPWWSLSRASPADAPPALNRCSRSPAPLCSARLAFGMPSRTPHLVQPDSSLTFILRIQDASRASRMCYVTVGNLGHFHPRAGPFHTPAFRGDVHPSPTPSVRFRSWDWVPDPRPCVRPPAVGTGPMVAQGPSQPGGAWQAVRKHMVLECGGAPLQGRGEESRLGRGAGY